MIQEKIQIPKLDIDYVRKQFPALQDDFVFMDNAGGSQILGNVGERINQFFKKYYVQLGASYEVSANAGQVLQSVQTRLANLINAERPEEVIVGPSTTMLLRILSISLANEWKVGDEVIVTNSDHEANVSCWMDLEKQGIKSKIWKINPDTLQFELSDLKKLINKKTRLVAMVHASNILGTINPIRQIADFVHQAGALFCVDGVAYAPHRIVDVKAFDADFYVFSTYKTYGPHQSIMHGKYDQLKILSGLNHYFIGKDEIPYKFQPGNFNFELCYSLQAIPDYLHSLIAHHRVNEINGNDNDNLNAAFDLIAVYEETLSKRLLDYLNSKSEIRIIGESIADREKRVPTISFVHEILKSSTIVEKVDPFRIGIRFGDFYAKKLIKDLNLEEKDGVVRVSMVHYNTINEVNRLIQAFETIL